MTLSEYMIELGKLPFRLTSALTAAALLLLATAAQVLVYAALYLILTPVWTLGLIIRGSLFGFPPLDFLGAFSPLREGLRYAKSSGDRVVMVIFGILISPFGLGAGFGVSFMIAAPTAILTNGQFLLTSVSSLVQSIFSGFALGWNFDGKASLQSMTDRYNLTVETLVHFPNTLVHPENFFGEWINIFKTPKKHGRCGFEFASIDSDLDNETYKIQHKKDEILASKHKPFQENLSDKVEDKVDTYTTILKSSVGKSNNASKASENNSEVPITMGSVKSDDQHIKEEIEEKESQNLGNFFK